MGYYASDGVVWRVGMMTFLALAHMSSFFVVSVPIHWHSAYTTASACLCGMERVPTWEFF